MPDISSCLSLSLYTQWILRKCRVRTFEAAEYWFTWKLEVYSTSKMYLWHLGFQRNTFALFIHKSTLFPPSDLIIFPVLICVCVGYYSQYPKLYMWEAQIFSFKKKKKMWTSHFNCLVCVLDKARRMLTVSQGYQCPWNKICCVVYRSTSLSWDFQLRVKCIKELIFFSLKS